MIDNKQSDIGHRRQRGTQPLQRPVKIGVNGLQNEDRLVSLGAPPKRLQMVVDMEERVFERYEDNSAACSVPAQKWNAFGDSDGKCSGEIRLALFGLRPVLQFATIMQKSREICTSYSESQPENRKGGLNGSGGFILSRKSH